MVNGLDPSNLDLSTPPQTNFYQFTNGKWLSSNPIPAEYSRWGSFEQLSELSYDQLRQILEQCIEDPSDANRRAVSVIYSTGMDEDACEKHALEPLADVFKEIDAVETGSQVLTLLARMDKEMGVNGGAFNFYSVPDAKNSSWEVIALSQSNSLGIGDRDFYFRDDKQNIRDKYVQHVANMLKLAHFANDENAVNLAEKHMDLETKIAESCKTKTEMRDPLNTYNKFDGVEDLIERTKSDTVLPWKDYFRLIGLSEDNVKTIIVDNPSFFVNLTTLLTETDINIWKTYLRYHVLKSMAGYLTVAIKEEHFSFFGKTMTGQPQMKPRWKRVLNTVTSMLEDSLGILYTDRYFTPIAKNACLEMVNVLTDVLRSSIDKVEWMQSETKIRAKQKLDNFRAMIGYPDEWHVDDIPQLLTKISREQSYCSNIRACNVRNSEQVIDRVDKPVDPLRWEMPCTVINAYFHPLKNVIVFPAAILQPPFFFHPTKESPYGDAAVNFSAIGAVICHEISHGYDDQGRKFDDKGELVDWWTAEDAAEYERRAANMVKLCDDYQIFGKNLNGNLCLGENIADYGGVKLSFKGLQVFQETHGKLPTIDGYTPEQRFFMGWATIWRNNIREENAVQRIVMDPHAPGEFRANIVQVIEEFHNAFNVKEGDGMYQPPDNRCDIW